MLRISFTLLTMFMILSCVFSPLSNINPGLILIGGEYTVQSGETRQGDVLLLFARINITEGGKVSGTIQSFGSDLEVEGSVAGEVFSYGGEVNVKPSARIDGSINTTASLHGLPQLPSILMVIS
jgi:hypothetical protein